jgi:hypothetical protein
VRYQNEPAAAQNFSFDASIMHLSVRLKDMDIATGAAALDLTGIDPLAWEITGISEDMVEPILTAADEQLGSAVEAFFPEYRQYS